MASPSSARGPRSTAPASPSKGPARTPTNRGEQATSTVEEATVVRASEAFQSEKCSARHAPDSASQPRSRRSGTPLEPAGTAAPPGPSGTAAPPGPSGNTAPPGPSGSARRARRPARRAKGASSRAPARQRQKASASAGTCASRTRMGEVEMATIPTAMPVATSGPGGRPRALKGATPPAATAWPRGLIGLCRVLLKQFPQAGDETSGVVVFAVPDVATEDQPQRRGLQRLPGRGQELLVAAALAAAEQHRAVCHELPLLL